LLNGRGWSCLRDNQGFGIQCASYIRCKLASHPGFNDVSMMCLIYEIWNFCFQKT
jgi:hypothetical protein